MARRNNQLTPIGMQYELAKQQQDIFAMANIANIRGVISDPNQTLTSLCNQMTGWDSCIESQRVIEITIFDDEE